MNFVFSDRINIFSRGKCRRASEIADKHSVERGMWVYVDCLKEFDVQTLKYIGGKISISEGKISTVTPSMIEEVNALGDFDGLIVPLPISQELLWNEEAGAAVQGLGELEDIFNRDIAESCIRTFYYEEVEKHLISEYITPLCEKAADLGKRISFFVGDGEIQYDFLPVINPIRLIMEGISLTFGTCSAETALMCTLREDCFIMRENELFCVDSAREEGSVLLITPVRSCRDKYIFGEKRNKMRRETPALCAAFEGTVYCERLLAAGVAFDIIDEYTLEKYAVIKDGKVVMSFGTYKSILVCPACAFCGKCEDPVRTAANAGILINQRDLIEKIQNENTEEI